MNLRNVLSFSKNELIIGLLSFFFVVMATFGSRIYRLTSNKAVIVNEPVQLIISEKTNLEGLSTYFDSLGVQFRKRELKWSSNMLGWRTFQRGSYSLEGNYSYEALLSKLSRGIQDPVPLVILPGINISRFAEIVSSDLDADSADVESVFMDSLFLADLQMSKEDLFGRMLPETYLVYWTARPKEVVRRILREFRTQVTENYADSLNASGHSLNDMIIMASIVEWEANSEDEKPVISGLYWNRLDRGMLLQADPTINYALGERRRLLFEDYQFNHPFNTYINKGLPPGPVTNPSLSTIRATVFPREHDYLYMVANPEGGHVFTRTFEEHKVESRKWRNWLREQYRIKRQQENSES